jgi:hypothetical protein
MKQHKLNLRSIKYSEKKLEENIHYFDKYDFDYLAVNQDLPESFIEKYMLHMDEITWGYICLYQKLSEEFIKKHINRIFIERIMLNKKISKKLKNKIKQEIETLREII